MTPTEEQKKIVEMATNPDIQRLKINALAGTGKTTTLCLVANKLNSQSLYLAFNKAMAEEAKTKFPAHVEVRTTHSLAFPTFYELKREAEATGGEILTVVNMVLQKRAENILAKLENYTTPKNPEIILVTAHKSKGLEWKQVVLSDDFPSVYDSKGAWKGLDDQERNLLYMACTRAENILVYNSVVFDILDRSNFKKESEK